MPTLNVCVEIYMNKKNKIYSNYKYFCYFQKLCQCIVIVYVSMYCQCIYNHSKTSWTREFEVPTSRIGASSYSQKEESLNLR